MKDYTEAVLVEYNPNLVSYREILKKWADLAGSPYETSRQYRSAVFAVTSEQLQIAQDFVRNKWGAEAEAQAVAVEDASETRFYMAEEYHQDFLDNLG